MSLHALPIFSCSVIHLHLEDPMITCGWRETITCHYQHGPTLNYWMMDGMLKWGVHSCIILTSHFYTQIGSRVIAYRQPNKYEARIQAMSVIAGCAKGLMYFQSDVSTAQWLHSFTYTSQQIAEKDHYEDTWKEIANFNKDIGAVREYLREGDCTDMFTTSDGTGFHTQSITQTIRSQTAIIVPVINVKNDGGMSDVECGLGQNLHWKLNPHTVDAITVTIPSDFGSVVDKFEVQNGKILDVNAEFEQVVLGKDRYGESVLGSAVQLSGIHMTTDLSTRLFVLANSPSVRSDIQKKLWTLFLSLCECVIVHVLL